MKLDVEYILLAAAFLVWLDIIIVLRVLANKTSLALDEEGRQKGYADLASVFKVEKSKKRKRLPEGFSTSTSSWPNP